jgi:predicted amidophosphoribosyltransferase
LPLAEQWLKKALNLGFHPWHLGRRIELVKHAQSGSRKCKLEDGDWIARSMAGCRECVPDPTPLDCARCVAAVRPPSRPVNPPNVEEVFSLGVYRWQGDPDSINPLSRMIRWLKSNDGKESCKYLAYLLVEGLRQATNLLREVDCIVPVPTDPARGRERGFDNILELAGGVESFALVPLASGVLVKTRATQDLRRLSWSEREAALAGSMEVAEHKRRLLEGASVLLLDDVVTSGTTLNLAAGLLRAAGAREVSAATLARSESSQASERYS